MAAEIRSSIPAKPILDGVSRDDLALADVITVEQTPPVVGTTWAWTLVYVPEGSGAALTPPAAVTTSGPMSFTADRVGSYLVRLVVDAGLPTESTQYVRLRALTASLGLKLVAAGERRDATGVIPVDVDIEGWANEQNFNLLALETAAATDPLADVLVVGNTTGGTDILMTTGDKIVGQTHVEIDSTGAGTNIVLNPDAAGSVVVNGKLTVTGLIDPTGVIFDEAAAPTVAANKGGLFVSDGTGGLLDNHLYYQPTGVGSPVDLSHPATKLTPYRLKMEIDSGYLAIETHLGWAPTACVLDGVRVYMGTVNTSASTYTLDVKKGGTSCLSGGTTFNMNTLAATTVTNVPLGGVVARTFAAQDVWTIDMAASDAAFNGADIYIQIVFRVS